jgi:hypothetical protein
VAFAVLDPNDRIPARLRRALAAVTWLAGLAIVAFALVTLDAAALGVLPALLLTALVALRRYPGERSLARLVARVRRLRPRPRASAPSAAVRVAAIPRGGLLIACSLAVRPPPRASLAAS